tara:strand:- start:4044 stop:4469 length:426 start_codon:yes stop_codon:yes gene_type:complete
LVYIGSTIQKLKDRFVQHKSHYKRGSNLNSRDILKYGDCYIELIKEFPCGSRSELCREEGRVQLEMDCVNHRIAGRTHTESNKIWREKNKEYNKQHYEKNKESIKKRKYEKIVCDICCSVVCRSNILRHKKTAKCKNHSGI